MRTSSGILASWAVKVFLPLLLVCMSFSAQSQTLSITSKSETGLVGAAAAASGETLASIDIAIRTGSLYWNGSSFQSGYIRVPVTNFTATASSAWSYPISPSLPAGIYFVSARSIDTGSNVSPMAGASIVVDSIKPTIMVSSATGSAITGSASDAETGLSRVEVALRDSSARYWDGSAFTSGYKRVAVPSLLASGNWNLALSGLAPGSYFYGALAFDVAGNFAVTQGAFQVADSVRPTSTVTSTSSMTLAGTASDNIAVDRVELAIRNPAGLYWDGLGFGAYERVTANLTGSGSNVNWSYNFNTALPTGTYVVVSIAFDTSGMPQMPFTNKSFTVAAPLKILAIGDSITEGYDFPNDGVQNIRSYRAEFVNQMNASSCAYQMVGSLQNNFPATGFQSPHEGYSGHRADHFVTGFNDGRLNNPGIDTSMAAYQPDVVLLHLGSNDMFGGNSVAGTVAEIDDVISRILTANPSATVLVANVIPWYNTAPGFNGVNVRANIALLGNGIISMLQANPRPNVRLANVRNGFTAAMMQVDLIHPNAAGEAHIADAFIAALDGSGRCGSGL